MENKDTKVKEQQPKQKPVQQSANDTKIKTSLERAGFIFQED